MEQTVQKALNFLETLIRSGQPRRLTELSRELGYVDPTPAPSGPAGTLVRV